MIVYTSWAEYFPMNEIQCKRAGLEVEFIENPKLNEVDQNFMERETKRQQRNYAIVHNIQKDKNKSVYAERTQSLHVNKRYTRIMEEGGPKTEEDKLFIDWYLERKKIAYDKRKEYLRGYYATHKEKSRQLHREYYIKNKESIKAKAEIWRKKNKSKHNK